MGSFSSEDVAQLQEAGIPVEEAERQLELLRHPPAALELLRPCTIGDGIRTLPPSEHAALKERYHGAAEEGHFIKFVPASGAATRMFQSLLALLSQRPIPSNSALEKKAIQEDPVAREALRFVAELRRFPFLPTLEENLGGKEELDKILADGKTGTVAEAVVGTGGCGLADLPKALLPFHCYPDRVVRSAFEEHLHEGVRYLRDRDGICRLHFTVPLAHEAGFEEAVREARSRLESDLDVRFKITFSTQSPSTDTLAIDPEGRPFRGSDGSLLLRPGGHGALLQNLSQLGGALVFIKNIDNILPAGWHEHIAEWKRLLGGQLVTLQDRVVQLLERLHDSPVDAAVLDGGLDFLQHHLGVAEADNVRGASSAEVTRFLIRRLDRPLRVCGVVRSSGEPGGGPFWVRGRDGVVSLQIVERSEVDAKEASQKGIFEASTHFNPVDLACSLRDWRGRAFDLERFVDPDAVFIVRKSQEGRDLVGLERPGLWNGGMARWNTVFVEVPSETFAPVKTLFDLLRPEHQPGESAPG